MIPFLREKDDVLFHGTLLLALVLTVANIALSYYAIQTIFMFFFDYPIGVAFVLLYPGLIVLLAGPVWLLMKQPSSRRVVVAGMILGLTASVFIHDAFNVFFPFVWFGEIPASILAMLATACITPMVVTLMELRRTELSQSP